MTAGRRAVTVSAMTFMRHIATAAARRPRTTIALWLVFVAGCLFAGSMTGVKTLTGSETGTGESARADARVDAAGLRTPAAESILVRSGDPASTVAAARALEARLAGLREVEAVRGPRDTPALSTAGGRSVLVQVTLRGDPDDAKEHVAPIQAAVAEVGRAHAGVTLQQAGGGTIDKAFDALLQEDLRRAELISLPVTLVILLLAFGAVVAASVPLLLGLTSVAAAMGAFGVISQFAPDGGSGGALVALIGLAVGVDYSLFYIRREREERRAGQGPHAALVATTATAGRAIVVSGVIVMVALAGLLFTGLSVFTSMALATMVVVMIAVIGSLTVLPATLALLGDRIDKGRIPFLRRRRTSRDGGWARLARAVTRRPIVSLVTAVCLLGTLAIPAIELKPASSFESALPADLPAVAAQRAIERAFPGAPSDAELVVTARGLDRARPGLRALGERARDVTGGRGAVGIDVARDGRTALVRVPMPDRGIEAAEDTVAALRARVTPTAAQVAPGAEAMLSGEAAGSADFSHRLATATPVVIGLVLGLAFVLLVAAFRSPRLAAAVIALNLLSVGAAYGVLAAVFQHDWAEGLLGFTSTGTVADWLPLFAFVILFGLSMDYTILVLERVREERRAGRSARDAAAAAVAATAGTVTSAAIVMVAVFAIFATMRFADNKQLGVGLSVAILLDATIVRGIALPAAVALIGDRKPRAWRAARVADAR
jgi:RND superfamily putative drug exporter